MGGSKSSIEKENLLEKHARVQTWKVKTKEDLSETDDKLDM